MAKRLDVLVCSGAACISSRSEEIRKKLKEEIENKNLAEEVNIIETGCMGPCQLGPVMIVYPDGTFYIKLSKDDIPKIVEEHFLKGRPVKSLIWTTGEAKKIVEEKKTVPFFEKQLKVVLSNCGKIDPENIEEYIGAGGYEALAKVLTQMSPDNVIEEITKSGIRGRGGAGFPTGLKWKFTRQAKGDEKYIICNADEGDPGAFMDRAVLEGDPHSVIEGIEIAGYAIGANKGYIYVRAEYPLAIKRLEIAINQATKIGLIGNNIFDTGFNFDLEVRMGAGAFVCGEETALIASIEGKRGTPRPKPPFPAQSGLWRKPTSINNVETLATINKIILKGSEWFSSIGTEKSKGTKIFALSGKIKNTGLVEVPMGMSLGEIIFDIGEGIPNNKKFKAVQMGGPSGGCIPAEHLNLPIDYESLKQVGAIVGSGGMIAMDEDNCMVNMAKFFIEFTMSESCGQCVPCRVGLRQMYNILDRITEGKGKLEDLDTLEQLGNQIKNSSLCGLGQTAPNPVLSTLRYFRDEYIEHIVNKKCRAGVCARLFYAPCVNACPSEVDVSRYVAYMAEGKLKEAFIVHMENNPFPSVCARVCPAFCEGPCERGKFDEPVAIREIKRLFADWAIESGIKFIAPEEPKKEKIAIIGSGPAGLSCAFYLTRLGYKPVVFESLPVKGGMMQIGIPDYRLPKNMLDSEIKRIEDSGVEIKVNSNIGTIKELKDNGFDAVFIGIGAHESLKIGVPGEELPGVLGGIEFLREASLNEKFDLRSKKLVVVGGGSTAMDDARTARRLGAESVTVIYRRSKEEMPAQRAEIEEAEEERIDIKLLHNPVEFIGKDKIEKVRLIKMAFKGFDRNGRRKPIPVEGSEYEIPADLVILCLGQRPKLSMFAEEVETNKNGTITIDQDNFETSMPGVFAGGDAVRGPSTIIESVADGRKSAISIDKFFGYDGKFNFPERTEVKTTYNEDDYLKMIPKKTPQLEKAETRVRSFIEVNKGLLLKEAIEESKRCLHCDRGKEILETEEVHKKIEEAI
jgi:NADH-quinone oxidoreductase subunit F